jgi:hypothetical protein
MHERARGPGRDIDVRRLPPRVGEVNVVIKGHRLPGRQCGTHTNVHVGLQVGTQPQDLVPGDADDAQWRTEVELVRRPDGPDFRGRAVHGRPGQRFLYLTWGELADGRFEMFRRAKLILNDAHVDEATNAIVVDVDLTDKDGMPSCARLREPSIRWSTN